jgi:hypothetical protein
MKVTTAASLIFVGCAAVVYLVPRALGFGGDPLASLSEPTFSNRYTSGFWAEERDRKSELWSRAVVLCGEAAARHSLPNCTIVAVVAGGGARERLAREELAEGTRVGQRLQTGEPSEISNGLTGRGAKDVPSGFGQPNAPGAQASDSAHR